MNKKGVGLIILAIVVIVIGVLGIKYYTDLDGDRKVKEFCEEDNDCVPKEQCHPKTCVLEGLEDSVFEENVACTAVCEPGTLDCGYGYCSCNKGKCEAVINGE